MRSYLNHLLNNWKISGHAFLDFLAHFIHGLVPSIKINHHQPKEIEKDKLEYQLQKACENISLMFGCPVEVYQSHICENESCTGNIKEMAECWRKLWRKAEK